MRALRGDLWVMIGTETSVRNSVLKIAIVEDSPLIVSRVQSLLNEIDGVELIGEASSYDLALELMERIVPDVMILDISLNGLGIDASEVAGKRSLGLVGMKERARLFKGDVLITRSEPRGTMVKLAVPLLQTKPVLQ